MNRAIKKALDPIKRRLSLMAGRASLSLTSDGGRRQKVQFTALKGEIKDDVERVQQYGFSSVPLAGAQVVFISLNGNRDHPIVISADDPRFRKSGLSAGEVAIYTDEGDFILLKRGNNIEIETHTLTVKALTKVRFESPVFECTGNIIDKVEDGGQSMDGMRTVYNGHTHPENDSGGPTDSPNQTMGT